jgi:hypothetical protein
MKKKVDPITMKCKQKHVMDREKNHIPLVNKNQCYEKTDSRKDKRPEENKGDSKFQRNTELGQNEDEAALIPFKRSYRLSTSRNDFLRIGSNHK